MNIDVPTFIISLSLGFLMVYLTQPYPKVVLVYPTPENLDRVQYRDNTGNCYKFNKEEVNCLANKNNIYDIPIQ
jgi:hypothetical protein|tara:strand:- start:2027 stop:2248 length:222 start_codon:yes stop_codon:yes gene_type:complete